MIKYWYRWILIISFLLICIFSASIDLKISHFFYHIDAEGNGNFFKSSLTDYLYKYGCKIGIALGIIAGLTYLCSIIFRKFEKWRPALLTLIITLLIGPGLIINGIFKEYWGRPRPKQIVEFGGKHIFRPFYQPNFNGRGNPEKSFPSGHTAMGFYFLTFCFIGRRYRLKWLYFLGCTLTSFLGMGLLITRIVQGGHFLSDTLFSVLLMWGIIYLVDHCIYKYYSPLNQNIIEVENLKENDP